MIPKKIHYCWFGKKEKPKLAQKCIASWKKYCPDYEIIEWNENNFNVEKYLYAEYCYTQQKYAFLSDFVRLMVVCQFGGIYLDTDVELIKSLDELIEFEAFFGFENRENIATGLGFGAIPKHPTVNSMCQQYFDLKPNDSGEFQIVKCPILNTAALVPFGLELNAQRQCVNGAEILPPDFLNPYNDQTGQLKITQNTISIHWYSKSWLSKAIILRSKLTQPFHRVFGVDCFRWLKRE